MSKRLLVIDRDDRDRFVLAVLGGTLIIGASAAEAEIVLRDLHVTRLHCESKSTKTALSPTAERRRCAKNCVPREFARGSHASPLSDCRISRPAAAPIEAKIADLADIVVEDGDLPTSMPSGQW